jgi:hypothetical protein
MVYLAMMPLVGSGAIQEAMSVSGVSSTINSTKFLGAEGTTESDTISYTQRPINTTRYQPSSIVLATEVSEDPPTPPLVAADTEHSYTVKGSKFPASTKEIT